MLLSSDKLDYWNPSNITSKHTFFYKKYNIPIQFNI